MYDKNYLKFKSDTDKNIHVLLYEIININPFECIYVMTIYIYIYIYIYLNICIYMSIYIIIYICLYKGYINIILCYLV